MALLHAITYDLDSDRIIGALQWPCVALTLGLKLFMYRHFPQCLCGDQTCIKKNWSICLCWVGDVCYFLCCKNNTEKTRMHSSRMRTAHSLTISHSICHACPHHAHPLPCMLPCHSCPLPCMPPTTHAPPHHACPPAMHTPCHACPLPPWTEFLTHASENITLLQLRCGQ